MVTGLAIIVLILTGLAIYGWVYESQLNDRYGPVGAFVETPSGRLHYIERLADPLETTPDERAIVLIHGASANARDQMISLMNPLAIRGHRVIAFDRPGHGYSARGPKDAYKPSVQARMIREGIDALGIEKPIIVGHSWGGAVAAAYALDQADQAAGVVVLSGATHPWGGGTSWYNTISLTPVIGTVFRHSLVPIVGPALLPDGVVRNFAPDMPVADYVKRAGIELLFRPRNFYVNAEDSYHLNGELEMQSQRYGEITLPMVILSGTKDRTVGYKIHSVPLSEQVEGSDLILLPETGHMPHHAQTAAVIDAIAGLVETVR